MKRSITVASCPTANTKPLGMPRIATTYPTNRAQPFQLVGTPAPMPFSFGRNQYSVISDAVEDKIDRLDDFIALVFQIRDSFLEHPCGDYADAGHVEEIARATDAHLGHQTRQRR